jgi:hypothetical protein
MSEMLQAIKADLTSRRILPLFVLALGLLVGAVAYAVLSGKASSEPTAATPSVQAPAVPGPTVASAPANPDSAVAETTNGGRFQHRGHIRNPFAALPGSESTQESEESSSSSPSASPEEPASSGSSGEEESSVTVEGNSGESGESSTSGTSPSEPTSVPPVSVFEVKAVLTRVVEPGQPAATPQSFSGLQELTLLPSKHAELLAFAGVQDAGKGALFVFVTPAIVHGEARCLPAKTSCESIYVKPKQTEELQYLQPSGKVVSYTLTVGKIATSTVPVAEAKAKVQAAVPQEREQLESLGVSLPSKVSFSTTVPGVLKGVDAAIEASRKAEADGTQPSGSGE